MFDTVQVETEICAMKKPISKQKDKMNALDIADCINETCAWSGKPVQADSLTEYDGHVVGFCNPGCRDQFETAVRYFKAAKVAKTAQ